LARPRSTRDVGRKAGVLPSRTDLEAMGKKFMGAKRMG
jgi:hypothetical protein